MKNIINNIIFGLFILILLSFLYVYKHKHYYNRDIKKIIKSNYNKVITIPDSIYIMDEKKELRRVNKLDILNTQEEKLFVLISGGCRPCIQEILGWSDFYDELTHYNNVKVYFVIRSIKFPYFKKTFADDIPCGYNILFDEKDLFININKLPYYSNLNTLFVNKKNRIEIIGDPIINEKIKSLILEVISKNKLK